MIQVTYTGRYIKVFNKNGTQVLTLKAKGRDPIAVYKAIKELIK